MKNRRKSVQERLRHMARSFQFIYLGQFAYFGYTGIEVSDWAQVAVAGLVAVVGEVAAQFVLSFAEDMEE